MHKVLIIDDEKDICFLISEILKDEKFDTISSQNSTDALEKFKNYEPDLIILDVWLGPSELDGIELLIEFKKIDPSIPIIIISGHGTVDMAVNAIKNGAYDFLEKPFNSEKLIVLSNRAIENAKLIDENILLKKILSPEAPIIGESNFIKDLINNINKLSNSTSRILISGPIGSGKKLIAQTIHKLSKRNNSVANIIDFSTLKLNECENLFEINNFTSKNNIFYKSNNGTLIFQDIDKMPLNLQKKIITYIENLNNNKKLDFDIKIISTTSVNLLAEVEKGNFKKDLFYRLNVIPIDIPPIKDRRKDIIPICKHYLNFFSKNNNFIFSEIAESKLESYDWPGNVRQIKNYIEKTVILNHDFDNSETFLIDNLPNDMGEVKSDISKTNNFTLSLKEAREKFEREYLLSQIKRFNGNIIKISEITGMERTALYRKLKSLKINLNNK